MTARSAENRSESPILRISRSVSAPIVQDTMQGFSDGGFPDTTLYIPPPTPRRGDDNVADNELAAPEPMTNSMPSDSTNRDADTSTCSADAAVPTEAPLHRLPADPRSLPVSEPQACPPSARLDQQEATEDELRTQLARAEGDLVELAKALHKMRRDHDEALVELKAERAAAAREQQAERERLRHEAAKERAAAGELRDQLRREQQASQNERRRLRQLETQLGLDQPIPRSAEEVAPVVALLETESLRGLDDEARHQLRRRLQLKWHPDKCVNEVLAKCVMQEFQRLPEWS